MIVFGTISIKFLRMMMKYDSTNDLITSISTRSRSLGGIDVDSFIFSGTEGKCTTLGGPIDSRFVTIGCLADFLVGVNLTSSTGALGRKI